MIQRKKHKKEIITELNDRIKFLESACQKANNSYNQLEDAYKSLEIKYNSLLNEHRALYKKYYKEHEENANKHRGYRTGDYIYHSAEISPDDIDIFRTAYNSGVISQTSLSEIMTNIKATINEAMDYRSGGIFIR